MLPRPAALLLLAAALLSAVVSSPLCENGFTLFNNVAGGEARPSCIKFFPDASVSVHSQLTVQCAAAQYGGVPEGFPLTIRNGAMNGPLIQAARALMRPFASKFTPDQQLVFVGARQLGAVAGGDTGKRSNWRWYDRDSNNYTVAATAGADNLNGGSDLWAVNQPE
jgi:hypothetical protein